MGETNIQWCARHTVDPRGTCAHGATDEERCLDVECERCWVKGYSANVWIGCEKVSAACRSCWAEAVAKRMGLDVWGAGADRQLTGDAVFASIRSWNKKAERTRQRRGVFWEDMGDLFEDRPEFVERRMRAFEAMEAAPMLDHMLLTKRPGNVLGMVPRAWLPLNMWPERVWLGVTAEDQARWDERVQIVRAIPRIRRFVSVEPLVGRIDGARLLAPFFEANAETGLRRSWPSIHMVILGGESGPGARPFDLDGADLLAGQCTTAGTAVFMKQLGSRWAQANPGGLRKGASHGQDPYRWPTWARRRELPVVSP